MNIFVPGTHAGVDKRSSGKKAAEGDGVVEVLRQGTFESPLFLVPGLDGQIRELAALADALDIPEAVIGLAPAQRDPDGRPMTRIEDMAAILLSTMRGIKPQGPYRLGGYSFGAVVAYEMACQLRETGETVEPLFLIEAVYDERFWPRGIWFRALLRRSGWQLARIARQDPLTALSELRLRSMRLIQRFVRRSGNGQDKIRPATATGNVFREYALAALGRYRPDFYDGVVTLVASARDRHFGCDSAALWTGLSRKIAIRRVDGDHLGILHDTAAVTSLAGIIRHDLAIGRKEWPGLTPLPGFARPMIVTTMRWFSTARLGHALSEAGFAVATCCPDGHALELVEGLVERATLTRLGRTSALYRAIVKSAPDVLLPDDERAIAMLRALYRKIADRDPAVAALIRRSLGSVDDWPIMESRAALLAEARSLGVAVPDTEVMANAGAAAAWTLRAGLPLVLKTDGSWGGRGVAIVREPTGVRGAWRRLSRPPSFLRGIKRLLVNFESWPLEYCLTRRRAIVNAQQFVAGREAIATIACLDGTISHAAYMEVVKAADATGPATVVRLIDHAGMQHAAEAIVKRFKLSGFCGVDFLIEADGVAQLIEVNTRITPTCHFLTEGHAERGGTVALFPHAQIQGAMDAAPAMLDVPDRAPALVEKAERMVRQRRLLQWWR